MILIYKTKNEEDLFYELQKRINYEKMNYNLKIYNSFYSKEKT
jgi:hypothetical protein